MSIEKLRKEIDKTDGMLIDAFAKRMEISAKIAKIKKENGLPVSDAQRESELLLSVREKSPADIADYTEKLYYLILEMSRDYQTRLING